MQLNWNCRAEGSFKASLYISKFFLKQLYLDSVGLPAAVEVLETRTGNPCIN